MYLEDGVIVFEATSVEHPCPESETIDYDNSLGRSAVVRSLWSLLLATFDGNYNGICNNGKLLIDVGKTLPFFV